MMRRDVEEYLVQHIIENKASFFHGVYEKKPSHSLEIILGLRQFVSSQCPI